MHKKLTTEPASFVYDSIKKLDQLHGPRLDWKSISLERLQKCKSKDERIKAAGADFAYTENDFQIFIDVIKNDPEHPVRWRALSTYANTIKTQMIRFTLI